MMDLLEEEILDPIHLIPEEIRGEIFNKLPQKEALNLRSVCQQWKQEVKNHYNFKIKLDERSPFFHKILQLRITELKIIRLIDHQVQNPNNPDPSAIQFKHPNLIRKLSITDNDLRYLREGGDGKISAKNLQQLLRNLSKSLKHLSIGLAPSSPALNYPFPPNISYDFKNLKHLKITIHAEVTERPFSSNYPTIWENHPLKQINNSRTSLDLTSLKIHLEDSDDLLVDHVLSGKIFSNEMRKWSDLILNQKHLQIIETTWYLPLDRSILTSLVLNNCDTIIDICIFAVNLPTGDMPFDLSIFNSCLNLKKLCLCRNDNEKVPNLYGVEPDLVNLANLPESIRKLELIRLHILTKDILDFLNSDNVNSLEELELCTCGIRGELGINSEVLEKILRLENIEKAGLDGFNSTGSGEVLKFKEIFDRLNVTLEGDLDGCRLFCYMSGGGNTGNPYCRLAGKKLYNGTHYG